MVLLAALAACGGGEHAPAASRATADTARPAAAAAAPARAKRTILFVGTSLTAGLGLDLDSAYPARIQRRLDSLGESYDVINAGVSGETSAGTLRRIDWLMRQPVDIVVLETGANDGLRALPVDSLRANLVAIIDSVRKAHPAATIVLAGMEAPPNLGPVYTRAFHAVFPAIAQEYHLPFIPFLLAGVGGVDSLNQGDGIHPNDRGERIVEENVWRVLAPLVKQGSGARIQDSGGREGRLGDQAEHPAPGAVP